MQLEELAEIENPEHGMSESGGGGGGAGDASALLVLTLMPL